MAEKSDYVLAPLAGPAIDAAQQLDENPNQVPEAPQQYNCGVILAHQGNLEGAVEHYRAALERQPDFVLARTNLGLALEAMGDTVAALATSDEAIASDPNHALPHWQKALLLRNGELEAGWRLYE